MELYNGLRVFRWIGVSEFVLDWLGLVGKMPFLNLSLMVLSPKRQASSLVLTVSSLRSLREWVKESRFFFGDESYFDGRRMFEIF